MTWKVMSRRVRQSKNEKKGHKEEEPAVSSGSTTTTFTTKQKTTTGQNMRAPVSCTRLLVSSLYFDLSSDRVCPSAARVRRHHLLPLLVQLPHFHLSLSLPPSPILPIVHQPEEDSCHRMNTMHQIEDQGHVLRYKKTRVVVCG